MQTIWASSWKNREKLAFFKDFGRFLKRSARNSHKGGVTRPSWGVTRPNTIHLHPNENPPIYSNPSPVYSNHPLALLQSHSNTLKIRKSTKVYENLRKCMKIYENSMFQYFTISILQYFNISIFQPPGPLIQPPRPLQDENLWKSITIYENLWKSIQMFFPEPSGGKSYALNSILRVPRSNSKLPGLDLPRKESRSASN